MKAVIETPRLALREMCPADLDFVAEMLAHPEVMRFYPRSYSRDEADAWVARQVERYERDGHGFWLAVDKASGQPVGQAGVMTVAVDGAEEPALGYIMHHPFWRRGLATEAAAASRDYALNTIGAPRVITLIRPENEPSQGVALKIGMKPVKRTMYADFEHVVFSVARSTAAG
jgi:RimJ/RimL family protein N-acetyltransferase